MTTTTKSDVFDPEILADEVAGAFRSKNMFADSVLVSTGAVRVSGTMPVGGPSAVGTTITVPYFGVIPEFESVSNDGDALTPRAIRSTSETATVTHDGLAFESTAWASALAASSASLLDPYQEAVRQIGMRARQKMGSKIVTAAATTPLVNDIYSATTPAYIDWDTCIDAIAKLGDESEGLVAMAVHSRILADMAKLKDSNGRPLLLQSMATENQGLLRSFCGVPLVVDDNCPLAGSMTSPMAETGTTPPNITLSGTPLGPWNLKIVCTTPGAMGTARFKFSTDGGQTYSAIYTTPSGGGAFVLDDSSNAAVAPSSGTYTADSLVGINGKTGITATFENAAAATDNVWTSTALLQATTLLFQPEACAFWYNQALLTGQTDVDILRDKKIFAQHLYSAAHLYRRRRGGSRPGVVAIKSNVRGYVG